MLRYLKVTDLAVVRCVSLELSEGLTALTGETGAGKSILVDALTLLLGARASADMLRTGARTAAVEAIFHVGDNPAALAAVRELGLEVDDGELILRRELAASGRGRAYVGGALQPLATLRKLGATLADIHGQHDHHRLLEVDSHLDLLDHFAGLDKLRAELAAAYDELRELERARRQLEDRAQERARRVDWLEFELGEIDAAAVRAGEDEELARERRVLANSARLSELAEAGYQQLYESDGAVLARLKAAARDLGELASLDPELGALKPQLEAAQAGVEDVAMTLRDYARDRTLAPDRLDQVESRLALLERLKAKYGDSLDEVLDFAVRARAELAELGDSDGRKKELDAAHERALGRYRKLAAKASTSRRKAARELAKRVEAELAELAMEKTRFEVRLTREADEASDVAVDGEPFRYGPSGVDRAEFHVAANVGEEPKPLARVASGGELSRLLLALRAVTADHEPGRVAVVHGLEAGLGGRVTHWVTQRVTVFDEVDAGIGGRVAHVLARKLRKLAAGRQVLCITHLAPVAAAADHHVRVAKGEAKGRTEVAVELLGEGDRLAELGRMIGGDAVTPAVRRHAEELVALFRE